VTLGPKAISATKQATPPRGRWLFNTDHFSGPARHVRAVNISQEPGGLPPISAPCADTNEPSSSKTTTAANIQSIGFLRTLLTTERARAVQTLFFLQNKNGTGRRLRQDRAKVGTRGRGRTTSCGGRHTVSFERARTFRQWRVYPKLLLAVAGKNLIFILHPAKRKKKRQTK
jgi:hypothetical protein